MDWPAHLVLARYVESQVINRNGGGSICNGNCNAQGIGHLCSLPCQTAPWRVTMWGAKLESDSCFLSMEPEEEEEILIRELERIEYLCTVEPSSLHWCSATQLRLNLCDPMDWTGSSVLHYLPESVQTHVHWVGDAIQPPHPLLLPSVVPSIRVFSNESALCIGGQSIGASTLASVLPMNIQGWFPLGLTGLISSQWKELSRVFSSTTIQKHQFCGAQPSLWFSSHIHTRLLEKL